MEPPADVVEAEWLRDYMASNAVDPPTEPLPAGEPGNSSDDQAEALPLSPSTFAWRFDDKYLAARRVKVDNFVSASGDEDDAQRGPPTEPGDPKPAFPSYLPSGMTMDDVREGHRLFSTSAYPGIVDCRSRAMTSPRRASNAMGRWKIWRTTTRSAARQMLQDPANVGWRHSATW